MKKNQSYILWISLLVIGSIAMSACSSSPSSPTPDPNAILTQAAQTVIASLTEIAALTPSPTATVPATPTDTPAPTATTPPPTATSAATNTPPPATGGNTGVSTGDAASFVSDVTIPDGTNLEAGSSFTKTWRIKNTGTTTWTTSYALVFVQGDRMDAPDNVLLPSEVKPGESVDISVTLTAPSSSGTYQGFFRLRSAAGQFILLDQSGDLWLKITVGAVSGTATSTTEAGVTATATTNATETATPTLGPTNTLTP